MGKLKMRRRRKGEVKGKDIETGGILRRGVNKVGFNMEEAKKRELERWYMQLKRKRLRE